MNPNTLKKKEKQTKKKTKKKQSDHTPPGYVHFNQCFISTQ